MVVFIDDILIYSLSELDYAKHLQIVLQFVETNNFTRSSANVNSGCRKLVFWVLW